MAAGMFLWLFWDKSTGQTTLEEHVEAGSLLVRGSEQDTAESSLRDKKGTRTSRHSWSTEGQPLPPGICLISHSTSLSSGSRSLRACWGRNFLFWIHSGPFQFLVTAPEFPLGDPSSLTLRPQLWRKRAPLLALGVGHMTIRCQSEHWILAATVTGSGVSTWPGLSGYDSIRGTLWCLEPWCEDGTLDSCSHFGPVKGHGILKRAHMRRG